MKHVQKNNIQEVAEYIYSIITDKLKTNKSISVALSGGNTPKQLFSYWTQNKKDSKIWNNIKFYWVDERAVPPSHPESNYGVAQNLFFAPLQIPQSNIFRMQAETDIQQEASRYEKILQTNITIKNNIPQFDLILLGIGDDGHTASIFPGSENLFSVDELCKDTSNPYTKQKRLTLTGKTINNAKQIIFIVLGISKKDIIKNVFTSSNTKKYPAQYVNPNSKNLEIITDFTF